MIRIFLAIGVTAGLAQAASAQPAPAQSAGPQSKIVVTGKSKRVCQRSVETGSLMPSRVCRTQEEWDDLEKGAMAILERARNTRPFGWKDQNDRQGGGN
jgi:hypothetical protein